MDYIKPGDVVSAMVGAGRSKLALSPRDLLIRGALAGAILGVATSLAFTGAVSTGQPLVGALIFPVGLIMIVLLGLELITGSFALLPLPCSGLFPVCLGACPAGRVCTADRLLGLCVCR